MASEYLIIVRGGGADEPVARAFGKENADLIKRALYAWDNEVGAEIWVEVVELADDCPCCGGQGYTHDGGYVACPACSTEDARTLGK